VIGIQDTIHLANLAGREMTPQEQDLIRAECEVIRVTDMAEWPLAIGQCYEDTVLMCTAHVSARTVTGRNWARPCGAWIDCQTPAAMAASLLEHVIATRHVPHPMRDVNEATVAAMRERRLLFIVMVKIIAMIRDISGAYCPMGCGQALHLMAGGLIECLAPLCPDRGAAQKILSSQEHLDVVVISGDGFAVQHPLRERLGGELFRCPVHEALVRLAGQGDLPDGCDGPGRYRARIAEGRLALERIAEGRGVTASAGPIADGKEGHG